MIKISYTALYTTSTAVYNRTGLTSSEIDLSTNDTIIQDAETEIEELTGKKFTSGNSRTEYIDGAKKDILGYSGNKCRSINLANCPIQSITEFKFLDDNMSTISTFTTLTTTSITSGTYYTGDYWLEMAVDPITGNVIPYGKIVMIDEEIPVGHSNVKVAYTYGYSSVPNQIKNLASCLAGIRMWVTFLGGNYNRLDSYSIPQQSVNKGEFYGRGIRMIEQLKEEAERLLDRIGRRQRTLYMATSGDK